MGERLAIDRSGRGEPIVLLHGLGSQRRIWDPVVPLLAAHHEVIAVDLPGFGDSPPLPAGQVPSAPALAEGVARELDALDLRRAHLVGNSLGGWVSLELARSGRAQTVVAISPAGAHVPSEARLERARLQAHRIGARLIAPLGTLPYRSSAARRLLLRTMWARPEQVSPEAVADNARRLARSPSFQAALRWLVTHNPENLGEIDCPVLIAWCSEDRLLRAAQGRRYAEQIPGARHRLLPGVGHLPQSDDPALVAGTILDFVAERAGASRS